MITTLSICTIYLVLNTIFALASDKREQMHGKRDGLTPQVFLVLSFFALPILVYVLVDSLIERFKK